MIVNSSHFISNQWLEQLPLFTWEFEMILENITPLNEKNQEPELLDHYGTPPEQYGDEYEDNY
jgi:hypothetical protein